MFTATKNKALGIMYAVQSWYKCQEVTEMKKINLRISELRHKKKITQQELADIVGVSFHGPVIIGLN